MGAQNRIRLDLDINKLLELGAGLPELEQRAKALGVAVPDTLRKMLPAVTLLSGLAGKLIAEADESGLADVAEGAPDPGPSGEGHRALLRQWATFETSEILTSFEWVIETKAPAVPRIWRGYVALLEAATKQTDVDKAQPEDKRAAIHLLVDGSLLEDATQKRLGDMLYTGIKMLRRPRK